MQRLPGDADGNCHCLERYRDLWVPEASIRCEGPGQPACPAQKGLHPQGPAFSRPFWNEMPTERRGKRKAPVSRGAEVARTARSCPACPTVRPERVLQERGDRPLVLYPPAGLEVPPRQLTFRLHRLDLHGASPGAKNWLILHDAPSREGRENPELRDKTNGGVN